MLLNLENSGKKLYQIVGLESHVVCIFLIFSRWNSNQFCVELAQFPRHLFSRQFDLPREFARTKRWSFHSAVDINISSVLRPTSTVRTSFINCLKNARRYFLEGGNLMASSLLSTWSLSEAVRICRNAEQNELATGSVPVCWNQNTHLASRNSYKERKQEIGPRAAQAEKPPCDST